MVRFCEAHRITLGLHAGRKLLHEQKEQFIWHSVAVHLGKLKNGFMSGQLKEDFQYSLDETHFVVDQDNGKILGFRGKELSNISRLCLEEKG